MEALRLLLSERAQPMVLVTSENGKLEGLVTKTDILEALSARTISCNCGDGCSKKKRAK
jgi:chloride channel protein, CIC family